MRILSSAFALAVASAAVAADDTATVRLQPDTTAEAAIVQSNSLVAPVRASIKDGAKIPMETLVIAPDGKSLQQVRQVCLSHRISGANTWSVSWTNAPDIAAVQQGPRPVTEGDVVSALRSGVKIQTTDFISRKCWHCKGGGKTKSAKGQQVDCPTCHGHGKLKLEVCAQLAP